MKSSPPSSHFGYEEDFEVAAAAMENGFVSSLLAKNCSMRKRERRHNGCKLCSGSKMRLNQTATDNIALLQFAWISGRHRLMELQRWSPLVDGATAVVTASYLHAAVVTAS